MIKGIVASKGKNKIVIGEVFVSNYLKQEYFKNMDNKILVCIQTDFANMNLFTKFKGIITNFGGILSHAAIYSREFKIPCIVGVKNATKILKEGDKVELNLQTGIIKILKK